MQGPSMVSSMTCAWMILTMICWLTMRRSEATTCHISDQEGRENAKKFNKKNNQSCESTIPLQNEVLSLTGTNGTLNYRYKGTNESLTLILDKINSSKVYMEIHTLLCENTTHTWEGKLRFGQKKIVGLFTTVFEYFQNYSFEQRCNCFLCTGESESLLRFFCNCIFTNSSIENAEPLPTTPMTTSSTWSTAARTETTAHSIKTHISTISKFTTYSSTVDPTPTRTEPLPTTPMTTSSTWSTAARTETTAHSIKTHISTISKFTTYSSTLEPTPTRADYISAARKSDGESVPTMAIAGSLIALVVIVCGVTVFICLRRRKRNKKHADDSEPCVKNPSYGVLQENENRRTSSGHDNEGFERNGNDEHTYDMADDRKLNTTGEQDYSYANFGGQLKFQDQESMPTAPGLTGNAKFLIEADVSSGNNDYDLAKEVSGDKTGHSTTFPENSFSVEKTNRLPPALENNAHNNYFVLENDVNERVEAMQTMKESFSPEAGDYFLVDESEKPREGSDISETENGDVKGIQGDDYFVLQHKLKEDISENGMYTLAQSQSETENGFGTDRKNEQKLRKTDGHSDQYDHVRVGHAQTNGKDDGVYDELRKQNFRYESEEVDNDYDRCPATEHI